MNVLRENECVCVCVRKLNECVEYQQINMSRCVSACVAKKHGILQSSPSYTHHHFHCCSLNLFVVSVNSRRELVRSTNQGKSITTASQVTLRTPVGAFDSRFNDTERLRGWQINVVFKRLTKRRKCWCRKVVNIRHV